VTFRNKSCRAAFDRISVDNVLSERIFIQSRKRLLAVSTDSYFIASLINTCENNHSFTAQIRKNGPMGA
jgi:hypothetical protein